MSEDRARHAILEVRSGPLAFRRAVLTPGRELCVGRTPLADLVIPHDDAMSGRHFTLRWDGAACEVQDLESAAGTLVGGVPVERASLRPGAWLRAGRTDFSIFFEWLPEGDLPAGARRPPDELRALAAEGRLFAVLDAARSDEVLRALQTSVDDYDCLFDDHRRETRADGAPYVARIRRDSLLLERLFAAGHGRSLGVFAAWPGSLAALCAHLRRFLMVTREKDEQPLYFRFYDPRVLRAFLPAASPRQLALLFGEIEAFYAEADPSAHLAHLARFDRVDGALRRADLPVPAR